MHKLAAVLVFCALQALAQPAPAPAPLKVAIAAPLGAERAQKDAAALQALLAAALGRPVSVMVESGKALPHALANGSIDVAWLSALEYVEAAKASRKGVVPAAKLVRGGMPFYRAALFVRKDDKARLTDLKGKRIAWVSQESATGYQLGRRLLVEAGFSEKDLREEKFFGDHAAVCKAVLEGKAELGATFANDGRGGSLAGCSETLGEQSAGLKVLATSDPIPNDVFALRPGADPALAEQLRAALIALSARPEGQKALAELFHADAFVAAADDDFALLRQTLK